MIIAIDFDGTVVKHKFPTVGEDVPGAADVIQELIAAGHKIILWTVRNDDKKGDHLLDAILWYHHRGINLWGVNENPTQKHWAPGPKAHANIFIDDMALGCPLATDGDTIFVDWKKAREMLVEKGALKN